MCAARATSFSVTTAFAAKVAKRWLNIRRGLIGGIVFYSANVCLGALFLRFASLKKFGRNSLSQTWKENLPRDRRARVYVESCFRDKSGNRRMERIRPRNKLSHGTLLTAARVFTSRRNRRRFAPARSTLVFIALVSCTLHWRHIKLSSRARRKRRAY